VDLKDVRSERVQCCPTDIKSMIAEPDLKTNSSRTKKLFLEEIDAETKRLAALSQNCKK